LIIIEEFFKGEQLRKRRIMPAKPGKLSNQQHKAGQAEKIPKADVWWQPGHA